MPPSLTFLVAETCFFISMVPPLRWIRGKSPRIGKKLAQLNNCGYACASLLFVPWAGAVLLPELMHGESWSTSLPERGQVDLIFGVYFYSKAWEFLDIILVSLMGIQPNLHFIVHHTTTPCLAWLVWTYRSASGAVFLLANVLMHIFLYAYFGGAKSNFVFQCTRICGHVQLVIGILGSTLALRQKLAQGSSFLDGATAAEACLLFLYLTYLALLRKELAGERRHKQHAKVI